MLFLLYVSKMKNYFPFPVPPLTCLERNAENSTNGLSLPLFLSLSSSLPDDWNRVLGGRDIKSKKEMPRMNFSQVNNARGAFFFPCKLVCQV